MVSIQDVLKIGDSVVKSVYGQEKSMNSDIIFHLFDTDSKDYQVLINLEIERLRLENLIKGESNQRELLRQTELKIAQILTGECSYDGVGGIVTPEEINSKQLSDMPHLKYFKWVFGRITDEELQELEKNDARLIDEKPDRSKYLTIVRDELGNESFTHTDIKEMFLSYREEGKLHHISDIMESVAFKILKDVQQFYKDFYRIDLEQKGRIF